MSLDSWITKKQKEHSCNMCPFCKKVFGNAGGLKSHIMCIHSAAMHQQLFKGQTFLFPASTPTGSPPSLQLGKRPFIDNIESSSPASDALLPSTHSTKSSSSPPPHKKHRRKRYSVKFKLDTVRGYTEYALVNEGTDETCQAKYACNIGIDPSLLSRWRQQQSKLSTYIHSTGSVGRSHTKLCPLTTAKWPQLEDQLYSAFQTARVDGWKVSVCVCTYWQACMSCVCCACVLIPVSHISHLLKWCTQVTDKWLCLMAQELYVIDDLFPPGTLAPGFKASKGWLYRFKKRYNIVCRRATNTKKGSVMKRFPAILKFLSYFRLKVQGAPSSSFSSIPPPPRDPLYGRFSADRLYNVDQVHVQSCASACVCVCAHTHMIVCASMHVYTQASVLYVYIVLTPLSSSVLCSLHLSVVEHLQIREILSVYGCELLDRSGQNV